MNRLTLEQQYSEILLENVNRLENSTVEYKYFIYFKKSETWRQIWI